MIVGRNNVKQGKPFDDSPTYLAHSHANELVSVSSDKTWCRTVLENFSSTETVIFVCLTSVDLITGWHKQLPSWKRCWPFEEVFNRLHVLSHKTPLKGHMFTSVLRACFLPILQTILVNKQLRRQGNDTLFFWCFTTEPGSHWARPDLSLRCWAWRQRFYHGKIKDGGQIDLINLSLLLMNSFVDW